MRQIKVTDKQIDAVIEHCFNSEDTGISKYPGMSYEQGVRAAIEWITGEDDAHPLEDE